MTITQHTAFLACVGVATVAQCLTGFAFGLILLAGVAVLELASIADAANVVSVLVLSNALIVFGLRRPQVVWSLLLPALLASLVGVGFGVQLLGTLHENALTLLRGLLGGAILASVYLLTRPARPSAQVSGMPSFIVFGTLSGIAGGLFASAGPPMVYHVYRQPWRPTLMHQSLLLLFGVNAAFRLMLVVERGAFHRSATILSLEALPVVVCLTWLTRRYPPQWPAARTQQAVAILLFAAGCSLVYPAVTWTLTQARPSAQLARLPACAPRSPARQPIVARPLTMTGR